MVGHRDIGDRLSFEGARCIRGRTGPRDNELLPEIPLSLMLSSNIQFKGHLFPKALFGFSQTETICVPVPGIPSSGL